MYSMYTATYKETRTTSVYNSVQSGVLTSTTSRRHGAISGSPLSERTDFGPACLHSAAITDPPIPQPATLWPSTRNVLLQRLTIGD